MGLINSVTKKWVDTGMQETPEEMAQLAGGIIMDGVRAL